MEYLSPFRSDQSCTGGMIHKIHAIGPGCSQPSITLSAELWPKTPFIHSFSVIFQREETIREEIRTRGKLNQGQDHRIGENDPHMSLEEKMQQRFIAERKVGVLLHTNYVLYFRG